MKEFRALIEEITPAKIAPRCGVTVGSVYKWRDRNRLPMSDLTGLTHHAAGIAAVSGGAVTAEELLAHTRAQWFARPPVRRGKKRGTAT